MTHQFSKGTKMYWSNNGLAAYEKLGNEDFDWWVSLDYKQLDKPLYDKSGKLNRFGWKWTDEQVWNYYKSFMTFKTQSFD